jgi:hypothetical protein
VWQLVKMFCWGGSIIGKKNNHPVVVFLTDKRTTPTKVVLSCFWLLLGLWQYLEMSQT